MDEVYQYIDKCLIQEDIFETDQLSDHELSNFLNVLMKPENDTHIRDLVLYHMQELLDERKEELRLTIRYQEGYRLEHRSNGDVYYRNIYS